MKNKHELSAIPYDNESPTISVKGHQMKLSVSNKEDNPSCINSGCKEILIIDIKKTQYLLVALILAVKPNS